MNPNGEGPKENGLFIFQIEIQWNFARFSDQLVHKLANETFSYWHDTAKSLNTHKLRVPEHAEFISILIKNLHKFS